MLKNCPMSPQLTVPKSPHVGKKLGAGGMKLWIGTSTFKHKSYMGVYGFQLEHPKADTANNHINVTHTGTDMC